MKRLIQTIKKIFGVRKTIKVYALAEFFTCGVIRIELFDQYFEFTVISSDYDAAKLILEEFLSKEAKKREIKIVYEIAKTYKQYDFGLYPEYDEVAILCNSLGIKLESDFRRRLKWKI